MFKKILFLGSLLWRPTHKGVFRGHLAMALLWPKYFWNSKKNWKTWFIPPLYEHHGGQQKFGPPFWNPKYATAHQASFGEGSQKIGGTMIPVYSWHNFKTRTKHKNAAVLTAATKLRRLAICAFIHLTLRVPLGSIWPSRFFYFFRNLLEFFEKK